MSVCREHMKVTIKRCHKVVDIVHAVFPLGVQRRRSHWLGQSGKDFEPNAGFSDWDRVLTDVPGTSSRPPGLPVVPGPFHPSPLFVGPKVPSQVSGSLSITCHMPPCGTTTSYSLFSNRKEGVRDGPLSAAGDTGKRTFAACLLGPGNEGHLCYALSQSHLSQR